MKLLNSGNAKTIKGEKRGFITYGLHLAPSNLSGFNVCKDASSGCVAACLNTAGRGAMTSVQKARVAKTRLFFSNKFQFMENLYTEIESAIKSAKRKGMTPVFRLNLTSDLPWEKLYHQNETVFSAFPSVQFYDYTKSPERMVCFVNGEMPRNYHLTFSRSETNGALSLGFLRSGGNVAMVFQDSLPASYYECEVIDGDSDDLRFLDAPGVIVGLKAKGKGKIDSTGFVLQPREFAMA